MVVFGPTGFCLQSHKQVCLLTCVWFLLSSSGCGFSIFFTIFTRHFVSLWLLFFLAFLAFDSFFLVWIVTSLQSFYIFFVFVSFYCVFTLLWSVYNALQLVCFFVVILNVCDFFSFCYLVVIVAVLLNLQFVLVILHLFVAAWGLTSVSMFWRFCNFFPASVFFGSLYDWCASLGIGLVFRLWTFGFCFFGPFVPFWCNFTFLCSCLMCLWKLMTVTLQYTGAQT